MTDERAAGADPMTAREFNRLVRRAVNSLPPPLLARLDNVSIHVRARPTPAELHAAGVRPGGALFGLYRGIPLTARSSGYHLVPPDTITIYREPLQRRFRDPERLVDEIRKTVLHELAHHFGISDKRLDELDM